MGKLAGMARRVRVEFEGAIYHVMNRGDRQEAIFRDDQDREQFLTTLAQTCVKTGWQVHAYCLMGNHFHQVVETPQANLVAGMKWLLGTYTIRFNRRHRVVGHLFSGRYKALLVDGEGDYLRTVCDYVHLNPARAKLVAAGAALRSYRWSSLLAYLQAPKQRPAWLRVDRVLGESGIKKDSEAGRREFERLLERRRGEETEEEFEPIRRGWCFGDDEYRKELLELVEAKAGANHYGEELRESAEAKAERLLAAELKRLGWSSADLKKKRKGDPEKVALAARLREETTVTLAWLAERLHMGTRSHLTHLLYWHRRKQKDSQ